MEVYELMPKNGRKSFYRKAYVRMYADGSQVMESYRTDILRRDENGDLHRLWGDWTAATGRHIKSFCGLNKAEFMALPYEGA